MESRLDVIPTLERVPVSCFERTRHGHDGVLLTEATVSQQNDERLRVRRLVESDRQRRPLLGEPQRLSVGHAAAPQQRPRTR